MNKILLTIIAITMVAFLPMGGCSIVKSRVARITTDFKTLPSDHRILYEVGAESVASEIALHLKNAIRDVEAKQFGELIEPVKVYAFATPKSFSNFSGVSEKAKGASVGSEVFLSGLLIDRPTEVHGMLAHELSHVQLSQKLGVITFNRTLPRWFREGLAIYVSAGGGAPKNYEQETIKMFIEGKHFLPQPTGALFNTSLNATTDIGPKMFYSQSGMFVTYLAKTYPHKFQDFLKGLQNGQNFNEQFQKSFADTIKNILKLYVSQLEKA